MVIKAPSTKTPQDRKFPMRPHCDAWDEDAAHEFEEIYEPWKKIMDSKRNKDLIGQYAMLKGTNTLYQYMKNIQTQVHFHLLPPDFAYYAKVPFVFPEDKRNVYKNRALIVMIINDKGEHQEAYVLTWDEEATLVRLLAPLVRYSTLIEAGECVAVDDVLVSLGDVSDRTYVDIENICTYTGSVEAICRILSSSKIGYANKIATAIYRFVPWARKALQTVTDLIVADDVDTTGESPWSTNAKVDTTYSDILDEFIIPALLLSYFYRNNDEIKKQVMRRYLAAIADSGVATKTQEIYDRVFSTFNIKVGDDHPILEYVWGVVLCTNAAGVTDVTVEKDKVPPIDSLVEAYALSGFCGRIINQLRLVAEYHHTTSIKITADHYAVIAPILSPVNSVIKKEAEAFKGYVTEIQNRPYMGLQMTQPEKLQVAKYPCLIYIGVKYHMISLPDDQKKKMEHDYKLDSIYDKIPSHQLKTIIPALVNGVLQPGLDLHYSVIEKLDAKRAKTYLMNEFTDGGAQFLSYLQAHNKTCAWRTEIETKMTKNYTGPMISGLKKQMMNLARDRLEQLEEFQLSELSHADIKAIKSKIHRKVTEACDKLSASGAAEFDAPPAPQEFLEKMRDDLLTTANSQMALVFAEMEKMVREMVPYTE